VAEPHQELAQELAEVARTLVTPADVAGVLRRIVELAVDTVEACDHAGVSLVVEEHIETVVQSDDVPGLIDRLQVALGEGPSREVIREQEVFVTGDVLLEQRWNRFANEVVERSGVRSMLAMRLFVDEGTIGTLNLYARTVDGFDDNDRNVASIFATHAALALRAAQHEQHLEEQAESPDVDVIGTAKGLIMAHQDVDEPAALQQLDDTANRTNRPLREVADEIVDHEDER
jgi:GAF domain-containing protein